ncbi:MAG TPA: tetratricopeptide repeat-containing glycosyltransferase family protein [Candidatus Acidoferrales bacterium]|nr:tetratricopeptide repeat-containing glycosyltransferase family protein [Candidatus Acidoferrales bacterium]
MKADVGQWLAEHAQHADALTSQGRHAEARQAILDAIAVAPNVAALHAKLATIEYVLGSYEAAVEAGRAATQLDPSFATAYVNLASALGVLGRDSEAIAAAERAIGLQPDLVQARVNLGTLLERRGDAAGAIEQYDAALLKRPAYPAALFNRGKALSELRRFDEALNDYQAAIFLSSDFAEAHVNLGMIHLLRGDFARGWPEYAWTMQLPAVRYAYRFFDKHLVWNGSPFTGKRLLITREQGLGDFIQMARFFPVAAALGGELHVECPQEWMSVVGAMPATFHASDGLAITPGEFDYYLPIMHLPRVLGIDLDTIPATVPYVRPESERAAYWKERLSRGERKRVGLVWAGNPQNSNDANRSMPVSAFERLHELDGVAWFGVQKTHRADDFAPSQLAIEQLGAHLADFAVTAGIVENLDLVISVDTSVAHLVGAMDRPVWLLLPYRPDWRWLLDRSDSPWYPSMRVFRQTAPGDWDGVIDAVMTALREELQPH